MSSRSYGNTLFCLFAGVPATRTKAFKSSEELGAAPLIWNPFLNRGRHLLAVNICSPLKCQLKPIATCMGLEDCGDVQ